MSILASIEAPHSDSIHEAKLDYYGTTLATCSSDSKIKLFSVISGSTEPQRLLTVFQSKYLLLKWYLLDHEGPVLALDWGHPRYSTQLVTGGYDGKVLLYSCDERTGQWNASLELPNLEEAVMDVKFSPEHLGLNVCCCTSKLTCFSYDEVQQGWIEINAPEFTKQTINSVSWCPQESFVVAGGNNANITVLKVNLEKQLFSVLVTLSGHNGWVKGVCWGGPMLNLVASCDEDGLLLVWKAKEEENEEDSYKIWTKHEILQDKNVSFEGVEFNEMGNILGVSSSEGSSRYFTSKTETNWTEINNSSTTTQEITEEITGFEQVMAE